MFSGMIMQRGRDAGVTEEQLIYLVACVHNKTAYLSDESALSSCLKAYVGDNFRPLQVQPGEENLKSGTVAPE